jgi:N-acetylglutamate synthase-like GNAT family acetyltransferase
MKVPSLTTVVRRETPYCEDGRVLLDEAGAIMAMYLGDSGTARFSLDDLCSARGAFVVARQADGALLGCGALRRVDYGLAEIVRIYRRPGSRGIAGELLRLLEAEAITAGYRKLLARPPAAHACAAAFFRRHGFEPAMRFNSLLNHAYASCLEKALN